MSRRPTSLAATLLTAALAASACGGDDAGAPAGQPAQPRAAAVAPYEGLFELRLSPSAARGIPDPSIRAGVYRLELKGDRYSILSDAGPYGRGTAAARGKELRFGGDEGEGCTATARYRVTETAGGLRLRAMSDGCDGRRSFFDGRTWRRK